MLLQTVQLYREDDIVCAVRGMEPVCFFVAFFVPSAFVGRRLPLLRPASSKLWSTQHFVSFFKVRQNTHHNKLDCSGGGDPVREDSCIAFAFVANKIFAQSVAPSLSFKVLSRCCTPT
jgi:hypothetical protein